MVPVGEGRRGRGAGGRDPSGERHQPSARGPHQRGGRRRAWIAEGRRPGWWSRGGPRRGGGRSGAVGRRRARCGTGACGGGPAPNPPRFLPGSLQASGSARRARRRARSRTTSRTSIAGLHGPPPSRGASAGRGTTGRPPRCFPGGVPPATPAGCRTAAGPRGPSWSAPYERAALSGTVRGDEVTRATDSGRRRAGGRRTEPGRHIASSIATMPIPIDSRQARASSGRSPQGAGPPPPAEAGAGAGTSRAPESST